MTRYRGRSHYLLAEQPRFSFAESLTMTAIEKNSQDRVLHTIEGNTSNAGSREGIKAMRRTRIMFATKRNYDFIYLD